MHPELEALVKAFDKFQREENALEAGGLWALYEAKLAEVAAKSGTSKELLHRAIKVQYSRWLKAGERPSTLPPRA